MDFKAEKKQIAKLIKDGLVKLELGEASEALLDFETALFFDSDNLAATCLAATCLLRLDRLMEAEALSLKAIEMSPVLAMPHLLAAEILTSMGKQNEAEFHLAEAISKEPHNAGLRIELARFLILGARPEEAAVHLRRGLEISPKLADARLLLALALSQQERWSEAEREIESLGEMEKVDAGLLALAGWLRMIRAHDLNSSEPKLEQYRRAVELLTRANQINPSIEFARELLELSNDAVERVGKPVDAQFSPPSRLRWALIAVGVLVYVVLFSAVFLWIANWNFSFAMLLAFCQLALYLVLMLISGLLRKDFSFLPVGLFMFIDRATKGGLTRWSNPVTTELFGPNRKALIQPGASHANERFSSPLSGPER